MSAVAERDTSKHGRRLTPEQTGLVVKLSRAGQSQVVIAETVGCSQTAVSAILARYTDTTELASNALKANALKAVETWTHAATMAAKKGQHQAVKELLEAAMPELRPAVGNGNSAQVVVMLGTSGQPLSPPTITLSPVRTEATERNTEEIGVLPAGSHKVASVNVQVVDSNE